MTLVLLMHHILGVEPEMAMEDFMKSSHTVGFADQGEVLKPIMSEKFGYDVPVAVVGVLLGVQRSWMDSLLSQIKQTSGSLNSYLDEMGIDENIRERIRGNYLVR